MTRGGRLERQHAHAAAGAHAVSFERSRNVGRIRAKEALIAVMPEPRVEQDADSRASISTVYPAPAYGVETMSEHLYRKSARELSPPEAALIAGLVWAPPTLSTVDQLRRVPSSAATSCWRRCASRSSSPPSKLRRLRTNQPDRVVP